MKVTWLFPHFHPVLAGAGERFRRYAPMLKELGIETDVLTSREPAHLPEKDVIDECLQVRRLTVPQVPSQRDQALYAAAAQCITRPGSETELVQVIKSGRRLLNSLWRIRKSGRPLVQVCTMVEPGLELESTMGRLKMLLSQWLSLRPFNAIVVSSKVMADWHRQFGIPAKRLVVINNGVDHQRFFPAANDEEKRALRRRLDLPESAPVCLFVGNMIPRKGVMVLVDAWAEVRRLAPEAVLVLVGPRVRPTISSNHERDEIEAYQNALFAQMERSQGSIRYLGERHDVENLYRASDVFAFPSEQEGFGNVILEAMACGLPVLTSHFRGFPHHELDGIVKPVNPGESAWAEEIGNFLRSPARCQELGEKGFSRTAEQFSVQHSVAKFAKLYNSLKEGVFV